MTEQNDLVERSPAHHALMNYQQADMDGIMVTVSRQAIHDVDDEITRLKAELESWKATQHYSYIGKDGKPRLARDMEDELDATKDKLAKAVEALGFAASDLEAASEWLAEFENTLSRPFEHSATAQTAAKDARVILAEIKGE